jgi:hypothetical protein
MGYAARGEFSVDPAASYRLSSMLELAVVILAPPVVDFMDDGAPHVRAGLELLTFLLVVMAYVQANKLR